MQSRVTSEAIIEDFNVLQNIRFSLRFGLVMAMMNQLRFQRAKKAFGGGVIVTITLAAQLHCI